MKTLKLALLLSVLAINSTASATGGKRMPPQALSLFEEIVLVFTINRK